MRITVALYEDSQHEPLPWRWIGDSANRAGITHGDQVERALEIAEAAGLLIVHHGHSVKLTIAGIRAARRLTIGAEEAQSDVLALPVQAAPSSSNIQQSAAGVASA